MRRRMIPYRSDFMELCISSLELRKALGDIEQAEENGFDYCLAVFKITSAGQMLDNCRAQYSDLIEKADPSDSKLDWGRFQNVSKKFKFVNGRLKPVQGSGVNV